MTDHMEAIQDYTTAFDNGISAYARNKTTLAHSFFNASHDAWPEALLYKTLQLKTLLGNASTDLIALTHPENPVSLDTTITNLNSTYQKMTSLLTNKLCYDMSLTDDEKNIISGTLSSTQKTFPENNSTLDDKTKLLIIANALKDLSSTLMMVEKEPVNETTEKQETETKTPQDTKTDFGKFFNKTYLEAQNEILRGLKAAQDAINSYGNVKPPQKPHERAEDPLRAHANQVKEDLIYTAKKRFQEFTQAPAEDTNIFDNVKKRFTKPDTQTKEDTTSAMDDFRKGASDAAEHFKKGFGKIFK